MSAEDQIRTSVDALGSRLRDSIARELDAISGELAAAIDRERAEALAAAQEERDRALEQATREQSEAVERVRLEAHDELEQARSESERARSEAEQARGQVERAREDAERAREDAERMLADRLAASVAEAESRAHAAGHAAGREDALQERGEARSEAMTLAHAEHDGADLAASARLLDAIRLLDAGRSLSEILDTLTGCVGREAARVAVLLVRGDSLRAWRFVGFGAPLDNASEYETPIGDAGILKDALHTGARVSGASAPAPFARDVPTRDAMAIPIALGGQIVAVLYADQGDREAGIRPSWPASVELMTRHAARSLEAITAYRAAQVLTERPASRAPSSGPASAAVRTAPTADPEEEEQSARRYARLLISEIKLYHEADVVAGQRERDLSERLGGEIARARVLYEQRVPPHVRKRGDYFGEELVRTLADGDAGLMQT